MKLVAMESSSGGWFLIGKIAKEEDASSQWILYLPRIHLLFKEKEDQPNSTPVVRRLQWLLHKTTNETTK